MFTSNYHYCFRTIPVSKWHDDGWRGHAWVAFSNVPTTGHKRRALCSSRRGKIFLGRRDVMALDWQIARSSGDWLWSARISPRFDHARQHRPTTGYTWRHTVATTDPPVTLPHWLLLLLFSSSFLLHTATLPTILLLTFHNSAAASPIPTLIHMYT